MLSEPVSARLKQAASEVGPHWQCQNLATDRSFLLLSGGAISRRSGWSPQRFNEIPTGAANCRVAPFIRSRESHSLTIILAGCPLVSQWDSGICGRQRAHASFWRRPFPIAVMVDKALRIPIHEKSRLEFPFERSATSTMTTS
jgi:hypothetical protein